MDAKKNVLLICMDHWPGRLMGSLGRDDVLTPTLDALAACGVTFTNAYSPTPVCVPARRELMTGVCSQTHGDRVFDEKLPLPEIPTMAQAFRDQGYQAIGVGKLHACPQRNRIGFDDVILNEEGRRLGFPNGMRMDDYARFLQRAGHAGEDYLHGMSTNNYLVRPWHLDEALHQTSWTAREMCEQILRRDPTKPAFWYCGFTAPHPPLVPPQPFLDMYRDVNPQMPFWGDWTADGQDVPYAVRFYQSMWNLSTDKYIRDARKGFYATCTHIDFSIRSIIGTLREEKLLDNTIIAITSDHGDMLGNHGLWAKNLFYEDSCKIPFILVPPEDSDVFPCGTRDDRLVALRDIMPTLLDMCHLPIPQSVEGMALTQRTAREHLYGELWEDVRATRMLRTERYKLIYYATGNRIQMFDMKSDPDECKDLSKDPSHAPILAEMTKKLMDHFYGQDGKYLRDGMLCGEPDIPFSYTKEYDNCAAHMDRIGLLNQRGVR